MNISKRKVVTSAVIVSPPQDMWVPIQAIRSMHDKAYVRWLPHINLIYPFVPANEFPQIVNGFTAGMAQVQPFTVTFDSFDFFEHGPRSCTLFLKPRTEPPSALQDLQAAIQRVFPFCDDQTKKSDDGLFHAHLTVGQFKGQREVLKFKSDFEKNWKPIQWQVKEVYIISRSGEDPFTIRHTISFGGGQNGPQPIASAPPQIAQQQVQQLERQYARNTRVGGEKGSRTPSRGSSTKNTPTTEKRSFGTPATEKKNTFGSRGQSAVQPLKDLNDDFEIRSTISDDFDFSKFELKKPITTTKRGPSVRERLAQQKEKQGDSSSSGWGSSSTSSFWDDVDSEREKDRQHWDQQEELERQRREEEERLSGVPKERPTGALGTVLDKAEQWIGSRNNKEHLPKNKAKLRASIKPMCQVKSLGMEPEQAIEKLKLEGYIQVASNPEKTVTYLKRKDQERVQYSRNNDSAPKDPTVEAYQKCKSWILEPLNAPKTLDALQNCLKQLCTVKHEFDPEKIVKLLEDHRVISLDLNDKVTYLK